MLCFVASRSAQKRKAEDSSSPAPQRQRMDASPGDDLIPLPPSSSPMPAGGGNEQDISFASSPAQSRTGKFLLKKNNPTLCLSSACFSND